MENKSVFIKIMFLFLFFSGTVVVASAQQKITVKGTVSDKESNEAVPRATILSGKPQKAIGHADDDGTFTINVEDGATLEIQAVGFDNVTIKVQGDKELSIKMQRKENKMQEAVVIGYVRKTREVSTGSSVVITAKDLKDVPAGNVMELLQGKVAGLNVNSSGGPGTAGSVFLRGISNPTVSGVGANAYMTPTSPLYVIDGVPVDANTNYEYGFNQGGPGISPISLIPTEDIERIEVLKDAQATSLYGSKGAYGVIVVTTKRGNSKVPIVQYTGNFYMQAVPKLRPVIGGKYERLNRIWQILAFDTSYWHSLEMINETAFLSDSLNPYYNNSTNWQDIFYGNTFNQDHYINISGGDRRFNYKSTINYYDEKGIIKNTGFKRYSLGMNMVYQPIDKFRMFAAVTGSLGDRQKGDGNGLLQTGVATSSNTSSLLPPPGTFGENSQVLGQLSAKNSSKTSKISTNMELEYEFVKGLKATSTFSYNYTTGSEDNFKPAALNKNFSESYAYNDKTSNLYNRNMLAYSATFNEDHNIFAYAFNEISVDKFRADVIRQTGTPNDQIEGPLGYDGGQSLGGSLNNLYERRTVAFAGSFSYNFMRKYVLDVSYRLDKASTNGPETPYAQNPSVGVRWNFNREKWFDNASWLDNGSVRLSWGRNVTPIGSIYDAYGRYIAGGRYNNQSTINIDWALEPNVNLKPSTATTLNLAVEAAFLKNKVDFVFETYYKTTENILRAKDLANINAFTKLNSNEMAMANYGYELTINYRPLSQNSPVSWTVSANASINNDILTKLPGGARQLIVADETTGQGILYKVGRNSLSNVLYNTKGVFTSTDDVPVDPVTGLRYRTGTATNTIYFQGGDSRWTDINGDYVLDKNDYVYVGNAQPKVIGGFNSYTSYKNFSLTINASYKIKRDIMNNAMAQKFQYFYNPKALTPMLPIEDYDYWKNAGDNSVYPNPFDFTRYAEYNKANIANGSYLPYRFDQTLFQEDGSYLKINAITLAYTFDRNLTKRFGITSMRLNLTMSNVAVISGYSGPNAENVTDMGYDRSDGYPLAKKYSFGLNIQF